MRQNKSIAVVIPVHNRRQELIRALRSVYHQTIPVQEVWVIDDASDTDLFPFPEFDNWSSLGYHRLSIKSNANVARNKGAELATAEFIAFLDSDDEWDANYIEQCQLHLELAKTGYFSQSKIVRGGMVTPKQSKAWDPALGVVNFLLDGGFAQTSSFIVERSSFLQVKFDELLKRHQDFDFFTRYSKQFSWIQIPVSAVIVHWEENRKVTRDAKSEMMFIERNINDIDRRVLKRYLRMQYDYFFEFGSLQDYQLHQRQLSKVINLLSFSEFKSFYKEQSSLYLNTIGLISYMCIKLKDKFQL